MYDTTEAAISAEHRKKPFHHENLCAIDDINRSLHSEKPFFKLLEKMRAKFELESRVNARARYYGLVYDLDGNTSRLDSPRFVKTEF
ncbi:MAG: hypothetical protein AAF429_08605 [Pseudomonadota bacterium]